MSPVLWDPKSPGLAHPVQFPDCLHGQLRVHRDLGERAAVWWAATYGVAQSRTRLKRLSSSKKKIFLLRCISVGLFCFIPWGACGCQAAHSKNVWTLGSVSDVSLERGSPSKCPEGH